MKKSMTLLAGLLLGSLLSLNVSAQECGIARFSYKSDPYYGNYFILDRANQDHYHHYIQFIDAEGFSGSEYEDITMYEFTPEGDNLDSDDISKNILMRTHSGAFAVRYGFQQEEWRYEFENIAGTPWTYEYRRDGVVQSTSSNPGPGCAIFGAEGSFQGNGSYTESWSHPDGSYGSKYVSATSTPRLYVKHTGLVYLTFNVSARDKNGTIIPPQNITINGHSVLASGQFIHYFDPSVFTTAPVNPYGGSYMEGPNGDKCSHYVDLEIDVPGYSFFRYGISIAP